MGNQLEIGGGGQQSVCRILRTKSLFCIEYSDCCAPNRASVFSNRIPMLSNNLQDAVFAV